MPKKGILGKKPDFLLPENKKKYKRGEAHCHPSIKDFDKEIKGKVLTPNEGCETLTTNFEKAVELFPNNQCMGYRVRDDPPSVEKEVEVDGQKKMWKLPRFKKEIKWFTYKEINQRLKNVGDGYLKLSGLNEGNKNRDDFRACIFEKTRMEWFLIALGLWRHSITVVTAYANLGTENLIYSLNKTKVNTIFLNAEQIKIVWNNRKEFKYLKNIVYIPSDDPEAKIEIPEDKDGELKFYKFSEVEELGKQNVVPEKDVVKPTPKTHCVIMFTSGSTGNPKGVMIKHENIIPATYCCLKQLNVNDKDRFISYLPLAHILELTAECCMIFVGAALAFGDAKTLVDRGALPYGDIMAYKPTLMLGVPKVWDTVKKGVWELVGKKSPLARYLFKKGYKAKLKGYLKNKYSKLWNTFVFNSVKKKFGGNLRILATGAAPISKDSHEFMASIFDVSFCQGYGLTEVTGACAGQSKYEFSTNNVGYPISSTRLKLIDVKEMGYEVNKGEKEMGEICVNGMMVTDGYFEDPELTKKYFFTDENGERWFKTGDIGMWNDDLQISIIDRKKNLVKLSGGEYVAQAQLEVFYGSNSPWIAASGILVHVDPSKDHVIAIIQLQKSYVLDYAGRHNMEKDIKKLVKNKEIKKIILEDLKKRGIEKGFKKFELIKNIHLTLDEWTPENKLLTASNKLKRKQIVEKYAQEIAGLFSELENKGGIKNEKKGNQI